MATLMAEPETDLRPAPAVVRCEGCAVVVRPQDAERRAFASGLVLHLCPECLEAIRGKG